MIPPSFNYHEASTLQKAIALAQSYGDDAKYMSGGHSLLPMMKLRFSSPAHIIDISKIDGLAYIKEEGDMLKIGGLTTQTQLEFSSLCRDKYPMFGDITKLIADPSVRNVATIGGNIAHGDAANDHPALMLAMRATIVAEGANGQKSIAIDDFFHGFFTTALEPSDILIEIQLPIAKKGVGGAYHKAERKVGDYAIAGVATYLELANDGTCQQAGIGLTNVGSVPIRAKRSEDLLIGRQITDDLIEQAATAASEDCEPTKDLRGSEAYKRALIKQITIDMLNQTLNRIK